MKKIREWFENDYENYDIEEFDGNLEAKTDTALFLIVSPHSGTNDKWMLRITTISDFDRWANSTAIEEFFDTEIELCIYLHVNQLYIYKTLLKYLSWEYDELRKAIK